MATLQEVYDEVMAQEGGREALAKACASTEAAGAFLAAHDCESSAQEAAEFLRSHQGELADAELESVAGGGCFSVTADCLTCGSANTTRTKMAIEEGATYHYYYCNDCGATSRYLFVG